MIVTVTNIIFLSGTYALIISEVELNPEGDDRGNEWIELFSEEIVNLERYFLENNDGDIYYLNGSFSGYFIVTFESQWLDNSDEKVILKNLDNETIDETILLDDSENNDKTWQFCSGWEFKEDTKNEENNCDLGSSNQSNNSSNSQRKKSEKIQKPIKEFGKKEIVNEVNNSAKRKVIVLNEIEDIEEVYSKEYFLRLGILISFVLVIIFIVILFFLGKI